jgi:hypothetical protein
MIFDLMVLGSLEGWLAGHHTSGKPKAAVA